MKSAKKRVFGTLKNLSGTLNRGKNPIRLSGLLAIFIILVSLAITMGTPSIYLQNGNVNYQGTLQLNGQNITVQQSATFRIDINGATYESWYGVNGTFFMGSSNCSYVFINTLGNMTAGGKLSVGDGTFPMDTGVTFTGSGSNTWTVKGQGKTATILQATQNINVLNLTNGIYADFESFEIDMNGKNGYGIYGNKTATESCISSAFEHLVIVNTANGYAGMYIQNPSKCYFEDIRITGSGSGFVFENPSSNNYGYCQVNHLYVSLAESNSIALLLNSSNGHLNINTFTDTELYASSSKANRTGIELYNAPNNNFYGTNIQGMENDSILLTGSQAQVSSYNLFDGGFADTQSNFIYITQFDGKSNMFEHFYVINYAANVGVLINSAGGCYDGNTFTDIKGKRSNTYPWASGVIVSDAKDHVLGTTGIEGNSSYPGIWADQVLTNIANTTATTFNFFDYVVTGTPTVVGNVVFDTTAIAGYTWSTSGSNVTITVTGTSLPATMHILNVEEWLNP